MTEGGILKRVICREHGTIMARIRQTAMGALYEVQGSTVHDNGPDRLRLRDKGIMGPQIPDTIESVRVLLSSAEADGLDDEKRGQLPAWCPECRGWRWVELERLRSGGFEVISDPTP